MASLAAILAIGYPVAFEARADERLTLGLISIAMIPSVSGFKANCTLQPPAKFPRSRIMRIAVLRMSCMAVSLSVMAGATVIESPVWIPMGSKFSTLQMIATLSL